ncbi:hypothetical protein [Methanooceanicella nereidis]|nr:hypothetical protein [Methanocella sp. CWC-04]
MKDILKIAFNILLVNFIVFSVLCIPLSPAIINANARADIWKILNTNASEFAPADSKIPGTASYAIVNWNGTKVIGNLGIGNGSIAALDTGLKADDVQYTQRNFLAADITANNAPYLWSLNRLPDLIYEPPDAVSTTVYMRLVGLQIAGNNINMGVRAFGYEY